MTRTNTSDPSPAAPAAGTREIREDVDAAPRDPTFLQVFTLVIWLTCLLVGLLGVWLEARLLPQKFSPPPVPEPPPVQAEVINVDMTQQPPLATDDSPPPPEAISDAPPESPPALPEVAAPSAGFAFAIPVQGPVRIGSGANAGHVPKRAAVAVEHLVFGKGTARSQPKPEYPEEAVAAHQEGTVWVQFMVGSSGHVIEAHVTQPSPWPLLNQAALRVVREEWENSQWLPNHPYLVPLTFKLNPL